MEKVSIGSFQGDLGKITEIQKGFFEDASDFVYFRKGEFDNIVEIVLFIAAILGGVYSAIGIAKEATPGIKKLIQDGQFRVISSVTKGNEKYLKELEKNGAIISRIAEKETGKLRYFVNEKRFCLFIRQRENEFFGVIGTDPLMISQLKELFEQAFKE